MSKKETGSWKVRMKDLRACLNKHPDATCAEKKALREWVDEGGSPWDNPYCLYNEKGDPMDFIAGCRIGAELELEHEDNLAGFLRQLAAAEETPDCVEPEFDPWGELPF